MSTENKSTIIWCLLVVVCLVILEEQTQEGNLR